MRYAIPRHKHKLKKTPSPTVQPHKKHINPTIRPQDPNKNQQHKQKETSRTVYRRASTDIKIERKEIKIKFTIISIVKIQT